jgi:hypothetical protein
MAKTSAERSQRSRSASETEPTKRTLSATPFERTSCSMCFRRGPSPTTTHSTSGSRARTSGSARAITSWPL